MPKLEPWRRNVYAVAAAQFIALGGGNLVFPFMPFYVRDLGVTDPGEVALWSGLLGTATGAGLFVFSPIWGSLAEHAASGGLRDGQLRRASDDEVIALVTEIKGVGRWTAEMLLIFCLGRPDVLPVGDLGVQRAMMLAYGLDSMPDAATMLEIAEPWRPYRSAGTWYLWRSADIITADITL